MTAQSHEHMWMLPACIMIIMLCKHSDHLILHAGFACMLKIHSTLKGITILDGSECFQSIYVNIVW